MTFYNLLIRKTYLFLICFDTATITLLFNAPNMPLAYILLFSAGSSLAFQTELKLELLTTVGLPQCPFSVESQRGLFLDLFSLCPAPQTSLILLTTALSFTILLLTALSCRNTPRHNRSVNPFSPCSSDVSSWMTQSYNLKLNYDKSHICTKDFQHLFPVHVLYATRQFVVPNQLKKILSNASRAHEYGCICC